MEEYFLGIELGDGSVIFFIRHKFNEVAGGNFDPFTYGWVDLGYAYGGDTGDDYNEEAISLTTGVKFDSGEVGMVVERKEKKGLGSDDHLFGLTEDLAEYKTRMRYSFINMVYCTCKVHVV
nr:transmembrane protein 87A-like [Tanacetum cinerariifolium]